MGSPFTEDARNAVMAAQHEAHRVRTSRPCHLLLGF